MKILFSFLVIQVLLFASSVKSQTLDNDFTFGKDLLEDIKKIDFPKNMDNILKNDPIRNITLYEQLIIEVDSSKNYMVLKGKLDNKIKSIQSYKVSTGRKDIKKPTGEGNVTSITLNPFWYPTDETIEAFKKRGIELPKIVPPGHRYNYMGTAKINLTHIVDGKNTFRIHGTIDETTIGRNESSGCIRMKNEEVTQLATLLNKFSDSKSIENIKVFLK
ncbi:MAG: L,D-transpeptidase [Aliarcobacter sp.]|nr:L,D-transpeptidase [Aliarcobacter sp.]